MSEAVAAGAARRSSMSRRRRRRGCIALLLPVALLGGALRLAISRRAVPVRDVLVAALAACRRDPARRACVYGAGGIAAIARADRCSPRWRSRSPARSASIMPGVEAKIFEGFTTCTATGSGRRPADLLKQIMHAPLVRCDQVQCRFLGISHGRVERDPVARRRRADPASDLEARRGMTGWRPGDRARRPRVDAARRPGRRIWRDAHLCRPARGAAPQLPPRPSWSRAWRRRSSGTSSASTR